MEKLIDVSKRANGITTPNFLMTDREIRQTIRWIGLCMCDGTQDEPIYNIHALNLMLLVTLLVFPGYYRKHELYLNLLN